MKKYYNVPETAEMLSLSVNTIRAYVARKQIEHTKFGGAVRFSDEQIQKFIDKSIVRAI